MKTIFDLEFNARNNAMKTEPQTPILPGKKRGRKSLGKVRVIQFTIWIPTPSSSLIFLLDTLLDCVPYYP